MNRNKEYHELVKTIKEKAKGLGLRLSDGEMAIRLNYSRSHFNVLKGSKKGPAPASVNVTEDHIKALKYEFAKELDGKIGGKPSLPGDMFNRERSQIKILMHHIAKLESKVFGFSLERALAELEQDTTIALNDLEKE